MSIEEIGCRTDIGGTALLSFLYHVSNNVTSEPTFTNSSLNNSSSDEIMYVGIGRYPYFCPRNTYIEHME